MNIQSVQDTKKQRSKPILRQQDNAPASEPAARIPATHALQRAQAEAPSPSPAALLTLQQTVGNRAVNHLIQTKLTVGPAGDHYEQEADRVADQVMHASAPEKVAQRASEEPPIQTKPLAASITRLQRQPEEEEPLQGKPLQRQMDEEEIQTKSLLQRQGEEEEVQTKPILQRQMDEEEIQTKPLLQRQGEEEEVQTKPLLQRQGEEEEVQTKPLLQRQGEEEEVQTKPLLQRQGEEEEIQTKSADNIGAGGGPVSDGLETRLNAQKGSGSALPDDTRQMMESRFGSDFSGVRVHADGEAAEINRDLQSQAFTHGNDIYFNSGKYDPHSTGGQQLLAHELTHTIQQGA